MFIHVVHSGEGRDRDTSHSGSRAWILRYVPHYVPLWLRSHVGFLVGWFIASVWKLSGYSKIQRPNPILGPSPVAKSKTLYGCVRSWSVINISHWSIWIDLG